MANVAVMGNVAFEPEMKGSDGQQFVVIKIGEDVWDGKQKKNVTQWWEVTVFRGAENIYKHVRKGMILFAAGEMKIREHNGKTYHGITAQSVTFRARSGEGGGSQRDAGGRGGYGRPSMERADAPPDIDDDSWIPF